jgi:hypothetical protein
MPPLDRQALVAVLAACLGSRPEIFEAYLFGSHVRGDAQPHSDIDVAVYVDPGHVSESAFGYAGELTTDLMRALRHDAVDVVVLNRASPLLYHRVLRDGIRVVSRDLTATTVREGRALSRYCDFVPHLKKVDAVNAARIAAGAFGR